MIITIACQSAVHCRAPSLSGTSQTKDDKHMLMALTARFGLCATPEQKENILCHQHMNTSRGSEPTNPAQNFLFCPCPLSSHPILTYTQSIHTDQTPPPTPTGKNTRNLAGSVSFYPSPLVRPHALANKLNLRRIVLLGALSCPLVHRVIPLV
jgi:hypothetical protein